MLNTNFLNNQFSPHQVPCRFKPFSGREIYICTKEKRRIKRKKRLKERRREEETNEKKQTQHRRWELPQMYIAVVNQ